MENVIKRQDQKFFEVKTLFRLAHKIYKWVLSPFMMAVSPISSQCRFYPSCSVYSREAFETFSFWKAFYLSGKRLSRCHPFYKGENFDLLPIKNVIRESTSC